MKRILALSTLLLLGVATAAEEPPARTLDEVLAGKILSLEKDLVEVRYDFSDPRQLADWVTFKPFDAAGDLVVAREGDALRLKGTGAIHHAATFLDTVSVACDLTPVRAQDLGGVVSEDAAESEQYILYCVNDLYFQRWDGASRPGHMICRFGIQDPSEPAGRKAFRYIARGKEPKVPGHRQVHLAFGKDERDHRLVIGEKEYQGKGMGREISQLHAGIYLIRANVLVDDVVVKGRLSPRWLTRVHAKLEVAAPVEPAGPAPEEVAARAKLRRYRAGALEGAELLPVLEDPKVPEEVRALAADALAASGEKHLVSRLVSLLYSEELVARRLAIQVVKGLTGKSFGYDPKAGVEKRSKAIKKLIGYIQKHPRELGASR